MIDPRFHPGAGTMRFDELARRAGHAELSTPAIADHVVSRAADLTDAGPDALSFISQPKYRTALGRTGAGIVLTDLSLADAAAPEGTTLVPCKDPYGVFVAMLEILYPDATRVSAAASARVTTPADYRLEDDVLVGQGVSIGPGAEIGQGTVLGANCVIGAGVAIGRNCVIGAGCVIECAYLGNDIVLQSGVVIGSEGFGFRLGASTHRKIPQLGRVIVQDAVEIGANSTIDRGTLGDTVIGEGTKIDNLVQIGHNCRIGRHCVISGMCGLSGSTILEDGVIMGGGVGTAGHLTLGAGTTVLARTGVSHSFPAGSSIAGAPAQDVRAWKREFAAIRRLAKGDKA